MTHDEKDEGVAIYWTGTDLVIPQHTDKIATNAGDIADLKKTLGDLVTEVGDLPGILKKYTDDAIDALKMNDIKQDIEDAREVADQAASGVTGLEGRMDDVEKIADDNEGRIDDNIQDIDDNEKNVAGNKENIDENRKAIGSKSCRKGTRHAKAEGEPHKCIMCRPGEWTDEVGQDTCKGSPCQPGKYWAQSPWVPVYYGCKVCVAGTFQGQSAQDTCKGTACAKGTWHEREQTEQHTCKKCAKGKYNPYTGKWLSSHCEGCPAGRYGTKEAATKLDDCKLCGAGYYQANKGKISCSACVKGKYNPYKQRTSSSQCSSCGSGRYSTVEAATSSNVCKNCPTGKYNSALFSASCKTCRTCSSSQVHYMHKACSRWSDAGVCKTKWSSAKNNYKCYHPSAAKKSCSTVRSTCESDRYCEGYQYRKSSYTTRRRHTYNWTSYRRRFGRVTKVVNDDDCRHCNSNWKTSASGYKFYDHGAY